MNAISPEKIAENWEQFRALCNKLGDRTNAVNLMLDELEQRMLMCPASGRLEQHCAWPGGLVDHSLRVLNNALLASKTFFSSEKISKESLILCALMHDLGKVGNETIDYYAPQDSSWHQEKLGEMYKYNKDLQYMTTAHRSIYMLQRYGIRLSEEEFIAILIHDGPFLDENKKYMMKDPSLATILQTADLLATKQEKQ